MTISAVDRFRIMGDLIKDGEVATESVYASVDKLSGVVAIKYGDALLAAHVQSLDLGASTNEQKAQAAIDWIRSLFREALRKTRAEPIADAAGKAETAIVDGEVANELGTT